LLLLIDVSVAYKDYSVSGFKVFTGLIYPIKWD